jgi:hypothetical protein
MIREQYLINFGRCTKVPQSVFCAVGYTAQIVFTVQTRAYARTYATLDCSLETSERVYRILTKHKLALCSSCNRVIRAADRFCSVCGAGQHSDTRYSPYAPTYRDDMGSM